MFSGDDNNNNNVSGGANSGGSTVGFSGTLIYSCLGVLAIHWYSQYGDQKCDRPLDKLLLGIAICLLTNVGMSVMGCIAACASAACGVGVGLASQNKEAGAMAMMCGQCLCLFPFMAVPFISSIAYLVMFVWMAVLVWGDPGTCRADAPDLWEHCQLFLIIALAITGVAILLLCCVCCVLVCCVGSLGVLAAAVGLSKAAQNSDTQGTTPLAGAYAATYGSNTV